MLRTIAVNTAFLASVLAVSTRSGLADEAVGRVKIYERDNLVAWCIVPFDAKKRGPAERAAMIRRLGIRRVAYDWRQEHVPTFEEEILEYKKHGIEYFAFWSWHDDMEPLIRRHGIRPQIWQTLGSPGGGTQEEKVDAAAKSMLPLVEKTRRLGLQLGLYNHGGWGGEPENLVAVCRHLRQRYSAEHVGIVYNFHHGHDHMRDFTESVALMKPYLICLNLNGMNDGAQPKILPVGAGEHEVRMMKAVLESGYEGPIGILGHQADRDVQICLEENLEGVEKVRRALLESRGAVLRGRTTVWVGTTTPRNGASKGIYRATLDLRSGTLSEPELAAEISSPGFVALHPDGRRLYSVCRLPGRQGGGVAAFEISEDAGSLKLLNTQPIGDGGATHLTVDRTGRCLFTAQYGGGSVAAFPLEADGRIKPRSALVKHAGSGPDEARQKGPHPHWVGIDPGNRFLFVSDLGIDRVVIYRMDLDRGRIERHGEGRCPPGSGPRHMKFHTSGKFAYVLNELQLSVTAFRFDGASGALTPFQTISTLPEELREVPSSGSEIRIHPSGRFLYAANRGHDSIAAFRIDDESGRLTFVEREAIRGAWPRNFNVDPSGRWLLAAGRNSSTISVFSIDPGSGGLVFTGTVVSCPTPICVEFQVAR